MDDDNDRMSVISGNENGGEQEVDDLTKMDFSHISKHQYLSKVFCWIEADETEEVKRFFDTFPHLISSFNSPNNWNPILYAVRYGNFELIDYFAEKNLNISINGIFNTTSIVHTAVYSGEPKILQYIFKKLSVNANPANCQFSPLKAALKATNSHMVEFLISRGALYVYGDVYNNLEAKTNAAEESHKYVLLGQSKQIPHNMVVEEYLIRDCPIKQVLKYARMKNLMVLHKWSKKGSISEKSKALSEILCNNNYFNIMMRMAVNKGDSILKKTNSAEIPMDQ